MFFSPSIDHGITNHTIVCFFLWTTQFWKISLDWILIRLSFFSGKQSLLLYYTTVKIQHRKKVSGGPCIFASTAYCTFCLQSAYNVLFLHQKAKNDWLLCKEIRKVLWVPCPCFLLFNHYFYKKPSLYIRIPNIYLRLGFEFGLQRIRDLAIVCPLSVLLTQLI